MKNNTKYGYYPIQRPLPFDDLPTEDEVCLVPSTVTKSRRVTSKNSIESILEHRDDTLLFMTMAVTMTSMNEMPIVHAYNGPIPTDIRGINRAVPQRLFHIAPHFYFEDSRILQYWNKPFETEKKLSNFKVSLGIDFSMTNEMTRPQKMHASFLNKLWVAWLQSRGHKVIPNVSFPDEWQEDYWIEGWPRHSVIAISSVGVLTHGNPKEWLKAVERIRKVLQPIYILRYGPKIPDENNENCIYFDNDNSRSANGW
ncbi:MAG: DUF4417 domain-containing protein [Muribaculaceae bacterium]|nr:DUF4417 domain-containing protein [Muribaculaceae bacterium]